MALTTASQSCTQDMEQEEEIEPRPRRNPYRMSEPGALDILVDILYNLSVQYIVILLGESHGYRNDIQ